MDIATDDISLALLFGTFVLAGLVKGVTGMGLPTVAMGVLGAKMSPLAAAALLVVPSLVTNIWQWLDGPARGPLTKRLWPMMLGILAGTLAGTVVLVRVDPLWSGSVLGGVLITYALYALCGPGFTTSAHRERRWSPAVGLGTGLVTGATGVFVVPAVPYLQSLALTRDELVQALGLSFTVSTIALAIGLSLHGAFRLEAAGLSALAIVPALVGMWAGQAIRQRISPALFRRCFLVFLLLLGAELALRPLLR